MKKLKKFKVWEGGADAVWLDDVEKVLQEKDKEIEKLEKRIVRLEEGITNSIPEIRRKGAVEEALELRDLLEDKVKKEK